MDDINKSNILGQITIEKLCALYVVLWIFIPPLQVGTAYRMVAMACATIWFVLVCVQDRKKAADLWAFLGIVVPCVLLMIIHAFPAFGFSDAIKNVLQMIIIAICGMIGIYYSKNDSEFLKSLICISMLFMVVFSVTTLQGLIEDPYASRIANSEWLEDRFSGNETVGLYGYIYMCVIIAPMLLYKIINRISFGKFFDGVSFVLFVLFGVMTVFSGYMIANFCFTIGCIIVLFFNNQRHRSLKAVLLLVIAVLFFFFYEQILTAVFEWLMRVFSDNPVYYTKLIDFRTLFLSGDASGSTVSGRFSNYWDSIKNALNYPIVGSYIFGIKGGGGHSSVFDTIGRYGWLIAILYMKILWSVPYKIFKTKQKHFALNALLLVVVLFGIFDPYSQEICIPLYLFLPYMLRRADEKQHFESMQKIS